MEKKAKIMLFEGQLCDRHGPGSFQAELDIKEKEEFFKP